MNYNQIKIGDRVPDDVNVIVEIPKGGTPTKYELVKEGGYMMVDRFLNTAMTYPGNYGFIPHTLSEDGDPIDVLVVEPTPVMSSAVVAVRPVGVLLMEDESGLDEKILAVPVDRLHPYHRNVVNYTDLPQGMLDQIKHFFEHYKDLEMGKWAKVKGWGDAQEAKRLIEASVARAQDEKLEKAG